MRFNLSRKSLALACPVSPEEYAARQCKEMAEWERYCKAMDEYARELREERHCRYRGQGKEEKLDA